jgi:hypothetical protein
MVDDDDDDDDLIDEAESQKHEQEIADALDDGMTLEQARAVYRERVGDGTRCFCCSRYGKIYKRSITSAIALALIALYHHNRKNPNIWVHAQTYLAEFYKEQPALSARVRGGDYAKTRFIGLLEAREGNVKRPTSGYWRITEQGMKFVLGEIKVPGHIVLLHGKSIEWPYDKMIDIREALRTPFDYERLMEPV